MKHLVKILVISVMLVYASAAMAFEWTVDKDHTEIRFEIQHIFATVSGQFGDFDGKVMFDPQKLDTSKFDFTVKVASVNTNNGKRDTHLKSKDFFNSDEYPVMKFISTKITRIKDNLYALEGMMTLKDVTQKMNLEFRFFEPKVHPFDKNKWVAGFDTAFVIPRLDFHVGDGKFVQMGVVGNDVHVTISMEALREK